MENFLSYLAASLTARPEIIGTERSVKCGFVRISNGATLIFKPVFRILVFTISGGLQGTAERAAVAPGTRVSHQYPATRNFRTLLQPHLNS